MHAVSVIQALAHILAASTTNAFASYKTHLSLPFCLSNGPTNTTFAFRILFATMAPIGLLLNNAHRATQSPPRSLHSVRLSISSWEDLMQQSSALEGSSRTTMKLEQAPGKAMQAAPLPPPPPQLTGHQTKTTLVERTATVPRTKRRRRNVRRSKKTMMFHPGHARRGFCRFGQHVAPHSTGPSISVNTQYLHTDRLDRVRPYWYLQNGKETCILSKLFLSESKCPAVRPTLLGLVLWPGRLSFVQRSDSWRPP